MEREFSAGAIVLRKLRGEWHVAAIEPRGRYGEKGEKKPKAKQVVALPKGNIDHGEKPQEAALREVHEETGLEAEPIAKLGDVKYVYNRSWSDGAKVFKVVSFYLFKYVSGKIGDIKEEMQREVAQAMWVPLKEAQKRLSYKGEREMAAKAMEYLKTHHRDTEAQSL
jgi:8-oxo-dGTP pyrophosphatase MutT (NUDIX family)